MADTISAERMKPVSRETIVPAAITALDFMRPAARPPFLGAGEAAGSGAGGSSTRGGVGAVWPGAPYGPCAPYWPAAAYWPCPICPGAWDGPGTDGCSYDG